MFKNARVIEIKFIVLKSIGRINITIVKISIKAIVGLFIAFMSV